MDRLLSLHSRMRAAAEGIEIDSEGRRWGVVYLDNVRGDVPPLAFAGLLSLLAQASLYRSINDRAFGLVAL